MTPPLSTEQASKAWNKLDAHVTYGTGYHERSPDASLPLIPTARSLDASPPRRGYARHRCWTQERGSVRHDAEQRCMLVADVEGLLVPTRQYTSDRPDIY